MKPKIILLAALTLAAQRLLGVPPVPAFLSLVILPMVWVVANVLLQSERHWPYEVLLLGLAWDLLFGPVVGPGGIAWTAASFALFWMASVVADRSPKAWAAFGSVGTLVMHLVHRLALIPLGLASFPTLPDVLWSAVLTGIWSGLAGTILALDVGKRWRAYRVRKLR